MKLNEYLKDYGFARASRTAIFDRSCRFLKEVWKKKSSAIATLLLNIENPLWIILNKINKGLKEIYVNKREYTAQTP